MSMAYSFNITEKPRRKTSPKDIAERHRRKTCTARNKNFFKILQKTTVYVIMIFKLILFTYLYERPQKNVQIQECDDSVLYAFLFVNYGSSNIFLSYASEKRDPLFSAVRRRVFCCAFDFCAHRKAEAFPAVCSFDIFCCVLLCSFCVKPFCLLSSRAFCRRRCAVRLFPFF